MGAERRVLPTIIRFRQYSLGNRKREIGLPFDDKCVIRAKDAVTGGGAFELQSVIMVRKEISCSF